MLTITIPRLLVLATFVAITQVSHSVRADEPQVHVLALHTSEVTGLAFAPNGKRLISTSLRDDRISIIVPNEGAPRSIGDSVGTITGARSHAVAVSPDGMQVAIAGFRSTAVFDLKTRQEKWRMNTRTEDYSPPFVMALAFSPNGQQLATFGSSSKVGGPHGYKGVLISIRNADTGKEIHRFEGMPHRPDGLVAFSHDGIAFSPDGKLFAAGTCGAGGEGPKPGELRVWDAEKGKLLHVWRAKDSVQPGEDHAGINGIAFSPDSRRIAIACSDGVARLWDVATKQVVKELKGHRGGIRSVAYHPGGQTIASAGIDRTVRLWDTATGQPLKSFDVKQPKVNALVFSPNGDLLVAGGGDFLRAGEVQVWQLRVTK